MNTQLNEPIIEADTENDIQAISDNTLVFFYGVGCSACDFLKSTLEHLVEDEEFQKLQINIIRANTSKQDLLKNLMSRHVQVIPYTVFYKGSKEIFAFEGNMSFHTLRRLCTLIYAAEK